MWHRRATQPRRSVAQAVTAARGRPPRHESLRDAFKTLAGQSRLVAATAVMLGAVIVAVALGLLVLAGIATIAVGSDDREAGVAVFVVATLVGAGSLWLLRRRTWVFMVDVLLWKREAPSGAVKVSLHVSPSDSARAREVLRSSGFKYVDSHADPPMRRVREPNPTDSVTFWVADANSNGDEPAHRAREALEAAGIAVGSMQGWLTVER